MERKELLTMYKFTLSAFADEIDSDLKVQMDVLDQHGIKFIEMRGVNGQNLTSCTLDQVREIKKQLDERGFRLSAVGSPVGKIKITDEFERLSRIWSFSGIPWKSPKLWEPNTSVCSVFSYQKEKIPLSTVMKY